MDTSSLPLPLPLLQRYREDRRKLLEYLFSTSLIKQTQAPSGLISDISNLNLDNLSTDYILETIQSGGVIDVAQATNRYSEESARPLTLNLQSKDIYFLLSDTESPGSPPRRVPPPVMARRNGENQFQNNIAGPGASLSAVGFDVQNAAMRSDATDFENDVNSLSLALPLLRTGTWFGVLHYHVEPLSMANISFLGHRFHLLRKLIQKFQDFKGLSDDDLLESAYEVFLVCMVLSGVEIQSTEDRRKDKSSKLLAVLKNKKDKRPLSSQSFGRQLDLTDTIRIQLQISESKAAVLKRLVVRSTSVQGWEHADLPHLSLGLLNCGYRSDFQNEKLFLQWKNRHVNIFEELLSSVGSRVKEKKSTDILLSKIRRSEEGETKMSYSERNEVLSALKRSMLNFSSKHAMFGIQGETYCWITGYHLNIRIYEKLLLSVFDTLEDGQLIEEADALLNTIKLTWPVLGIIDKLHDALYAWVLFQQFVVNQEAELLHRVIVQVQMVLQPGECNENEEAYLANLFCIIAINGSKRQLTVVQSILLSMGQWCDQKLQDYHLYFDQKASLFKMVMKMAWTLGSSDLDKHSKVESRESDILSKAFRRKVKSHVFQSLEAVCNRVPEKVSLGSDMRRMHPLALLASELKLVVNKELSIYYPVLRHWCPEAGVVIATKLHQFYGERLRPFLRNVSCLSGDVRAVLPAADKLERCLTELYFSAYEENAQVDPPKKELEPFKIGEISQPIILDWVIAQHERILEWTGRAFGLEEWEPLSSQQKQASSAVEVFRILEETVAQFFELDLPLDITHLQALLSTIFHTLDAYLRKIISQFVDKNNLYPSPPPLTRYTETTFPLIKKKLVQCIVMEGEVNEKLSRLTASKLCVRLNTLQYIQLQISELEDYIRSSWAAVCKYHSSTNGHSNSTRDEVANMHEESFGELFVATFDCLRDAASDATKKICDFIGVRVVFWDLRDHFLYHLYHGGVQSGRLDGILPHFDKVLNNVCGLIDDTLRDIVVSSILIASLEGFIWILLDGGPACAYSDSDIPMMAEDLNMLKDLFVAEGEGLPRSLVEKEAKFAHQVLDLFSLQTESVIQMLRSSSENITVGLDGHKWRQRSLYDAHTLIRVLCHKKDKESSKFLKLNYQLPASSEYAESASDDYGSKSSPLVADFLQRSRSFHWTPTGSSSFGSLRKKFQEATTSFRKI